MNLLQTKILIDLIFQGVTAGLEALKELKNSTEYSAEVKEMINLRIDKSRQKVEEYFKDLK